MPARKSGDHPGPATTGSLTVDPPMVANVPSTVAVDGAPADTDVTFSVAQPSHGADETVVRADGSGHAETVVVPNGAGELTPGHCLM